MRSVFKTFVIALLVGTVSVPTVKKVANVAYEAVKTEYCYLVAGLDDAASNTDALLVITYDSKDNSSSIIQIPRDTYCKFGSGLNKINHLYASFRTSGLSPEKSMKKTTEFIGERLGIDFDGYVAITTKAFKNAVDSIGGVYITLSDDFVYKDSKNQYSFILPKGENILDGQKAEIFVRYRKGYALGDLGRLDAQKIFINGFYNTVTKRVGFDELIRGISDVKDGVITDFSITNIFIMVFKHSSKFRDVNITYLTMPGESACDESGTWYYVLNRKACENVLQKHFHKFNGTFDIKKEFTDINKPLFNKIYNRTDIGFKEYGMNEILDIDIIKNKK